MISRVTRSKAVAKKNYNRLSRWYDLLSGSAEARHRNLALAKLDARQGEKILEIGCGTGHALLSLAKAVGSDGRVFGLDISEGMLAVSQSRLQAGGLENRVELRVEDASQMSFDTGFFDAVFMSFTLELFDSPEIQSVLARCKAVLRPSGRISLASLVKSAQPGMPERIYEWFHSRLPALVDCRPILAQASLREAGFDIKDVTSASMWGLPVEIILAHKKEE